MDFKDCVKFANENKTCYLATCEGDQPRVRAMGMWKADEDGFWFQGQTVKAFFKQLQKNPLSPFIICRVCGINFATPIKRKSQTF